MDPNQNNFGAPTAVIMAFVLGVVGVAMQKDPLKSARPAKLSNFSSENIGLQDVDARLWQDPLMAIKSMKHEETGPTEDCKNNHDFDIFAQKDQESEKKECIDYINNKVTFLGVTTRWGPYLEDQENRRRMRYAVLSGLGTSGYFPDDPTHIGYIKPESSSSHYFPLAKLTNVEYKVQNNDFPEYVPFEIFTKAQKEKESPPQKIILLWLDVSFFSPQNPGNKSPQGPLKFHKLVSKLVLGESSKYPSEGLQHISLKLIGPTDSGSLQSWLQIIGKNEKNHKKTSAGKDDFIVQSEDFNGAYEKHPQVPTLNIYSPYATAPTEALHEPFKGKEYIIRRELTLKTSTVRVNLFRTVNNDRKLAETLRDELKRRGVNFDTEFKDDIPPKIVLISEGDTIYGRYFKKNLVTAFDLDHICPEDEIGSCPISMVKYMRGLDGEMKENESTANKKRRKPEQMALVQSIQEMPHGDKQYDYLRRLARSLKNKNDNLKKLGKQGFPPEYKSNIKAIGIVGTDIYDKLIILQALKKDFPETIFFTTDLEANLMNTDELASSRNLIVASSFGLQLSENLQAGVPPFRENYQTATYLATLAAFNEGSSFWTKQFLKNPQGVLKPRIYEIGRTHAIDLSTDKDVIACNQNNVDNCSIHPERNLPDNLAWSLMWYLLFSVILCTYLSIRSRTQAKKLYLKYKLLIFWFIFIVIGFVVLHIWIGFSISTEPNEEPLYWWEGVSVWPTNFIRLASILLSWTFILLSLKWLNDSREELGKTFFQTVRTTTAPDKANSRVSRFKDLFFFSFDRCKNQKSPLKPSDIWNDYLQHSTFNKKVVRIAIGLFLFFCFFILVSSIFNELPNIPYRSSFSKNVTGGVIISAVLSFLILLLFVVDEIRLSNKLIDILANNQIDWADKTFEQFKIKRMPANRIPDTANWERFLGSRIKVKCIAHFTDTVDDLLYFPFIILLLLVISRFRIFDNWNMPLPLLIFIVTNFFIAVFYGFSLHRTAKKAKEKLLHEMSDDEIQLLSKASISPPGQNNQITRGDLQVLTERIIETTQAIRNGAFVPFWEQPILQSIMIPFSGYGGFAILEYALFI